MRVLVTGGTGYLGGSIVRALHARGHHPIVFARRASSAGLPGIAHDGDIRDRRALQLAAAGADAIVHAAALVSIWRPVPREFDDVNVGGLQNVLEVVQALGLRRVVYTSSFLARPPAGLSRPLQANDYQRTKVRALEAARAASAAGLPIVTLVPGVIYGPGADTEGNLVGRLLRDHLRGRLPGVVGGHCRWSCAWVEDVADAHVEAVVREAAHGEYAVGGENVAQMHLFDIVRNLTGRPLPRRLPFALAGAVARVEEAKARCFGRSPRLTRGTLDILRHDWSLNSQRSAVELSYRITPLETGIRRILSERVG